MDPRRESITGGNKGDIKSRHERELKITVEEEKKARKNDKALIVISHDAYWTGNKMQKEKKIDN